MTYRLFCDTKHGQNKGHYSNLAQFTDYQYFIIKTSACNADKKGEFSYNKNGK